MDPTRLERLRKFGACATNRPANFEDVAAGVAEIDRLRARVAELETIEQRAREVRDDGDWVAARVAGYILGGA